MTEVAGKEAAVGSQRNSLSQQITVGVAISIIAMFVVWVTSTTRANDKEIVVLKAQFCQFTERMSQDIKEIKENLQAQSIALQETASVSRELGAIIRESQRHEGSPVMGGAVGVWTTT
jgi:hypothetical protein